MLPPSHGGGHEFESRRVHYFFTCICRQLARVVREQVAHIFSIQISIGLSLEPSNTNMNASSCRPQSYSTVIGREFRSESDLCELLPNSATNLDSKMLARLHE